MSDIIIMVITIISLPILMFIIRIRFIIGPTLAGTCGQVMSVLAQMDVIVRANAGLPLALPSSPPPAANAISCWV